MGFGPAPYAQRVYGQVDYSESPYVFALTDSVATSDATALSLQHALADSLSTSDAFGALMMGILSDTQAAPTDALIISTLATLAESISSGETLTTALTALFSESIAVSDGSAESVTRALADTLAAATDVLGISMQVALSEAPWALPPGATITPHGYGAFRYGPSMYSTDTYIPAIVDALSTAITIALADALAISESNAASILNALADTVTVTDSESATADRVGLSDFLIMKEFISIRLARSSNVWKEGGVNRIVTPHIYGNVLYARNMYSTNIAILWAATQLGPAPAWRIGSAQSRTVTPHVYGNVLYARNMYSTNIAILWAAIQRSTGPGFTNDDGHKYNN